MMHSRIQKIRKLLSDHDLDALLVTDVYDITYLTNFSNFSPTEREAYLLITNKNQYILTDGRYTEAVKKEIPNFTLREITSAKSIAANLKTIADKDSLSTIGFQGDNITVAEYKKILSSFKKKRSISLDALRIAKEKSEIATITKACSIADQAFANILPKIQIGMSEKELALALEYEIRKQGATLSFPTIVAFGANAAVPHHQTSDIKLKRNSLILIDFGARYENYCSDCTRTFFFGKVTTEQKKIYQTVSDAQQTAIDFIRGKNGKVRASDVDKIAREHILSQGYPSIPHSLGHGTGIEVHEEPRLSPKSKDFLEEGMVFSIEPGIYIPEFGGVRIEDLFTIKNNKLTQLTKSPKEFLQL